MSEENPYKLTGTREIYTNPWISVREDQVIRPGGAPGIFGVVEMRDGAMAIALNFQKEIYLVHEYRYAVARRSFEAAGGVIDEGENPLETAKRELKEELGLISDTWINLGMVDPFTTVIKSENHMFLALNVKEVPASVEEGEVITTVKVPFDEALEMVIQSKITHSATCVAILKADRYLKENF